MSEERRKMDKQATGTVPKSKGRNNTPYTNDRDSPRSWTTNNNLTSDLQHRLNLSEFLRIGNSRRNLPSHHNYCMMNSTADEPQRRFNTSVSTGSMTPNTSSSNSRRNSTSTVPKCDNVTKYPDKMQIEDKLSQIREYLQITNSLMSSIKNTDEQSEEVAAEKENLVRMIADLKDSEAKLVDILESLEICQSQFPIIENTVDINSEASHRNETDEMALVSLHQKAENKLRDARLVQDKLLAGQYGNDLNSSNRRDKNLQSMQDYDMAILELEERTKRLKEPEPRRGSNTQLQDKLLAEVDNLQSQIITLHNVNEDRTELIHVLDNRDAELRAQHTELQSKLSELQNRKLQVDQIVSQLQNLDEAEEDDVGAQVRKIVTMKDQLAKLKDMLEIVKTTESVVTNGTASQEEQELACEICTKAENFLQKADGGGGGPGGSNAGEKCKPPQVQNEIRYDNTGILNENRNKQVNKNSVPGDGYGGAKPRLSNCNKLALQAELEAKKRELEEIMGKHKASTSNLNHDVGNDNKSEFSCSSNAFFDGGAHGWVPLMADHNRFDSASESDGCPEDVNEYSDMNSTTHHHNDSFTLPLMNFPQDRKRDGKQRTAAEAEYVHALASDRLSVTRTPERSMRSNSATSANYTRERPRANSDQGNSKNQVQKQLELIRSVCDSMLEQQQQQANNQQPANVQQLRNNLTPSPQYSEPRRFAQSPNPHSMNALNVVNPLADVSAWSPPNNNSNNNNNNNQPTDGGQAAGWLATNTLQTQAFMMNTLNQCCQMLWLQQRELMSLRQNVSQLQERIDNNPIESSSQLASPMVPTPVGDQPRSSRSNQQKVNQQVSAACSMPNLNQYNVLPPPHHSLAAAAAANNARLLDASCLNNANLNLNPIDNVNNGVLHSVNAANINQMHQPSHHAQMWNGQALNNQVAPGNRANNYWDNFRSYSRQNLLSTKSNEGFQNVVSSSSCSSSNGLDRSNVAERTNPFTLMSLAKSNSDHHHAPSSTSGNATTSENTAHHRPTSQFVPIRHSATDTPRNNVCVVPPDVLNVNHNTTTTKVQEPTPIDLPHLPNNIHARNATATNNEHETPTTAAVAAELCYQTYLNNVFGYNENSSNNSNISEEQIFKDCIPETTRRRNEWHEEPVEEPFPKSKLFEELRDNVYKEVVSLISANEARPHFLIQLFRDLQMISSDPLRLKILQCIQTIITHSLISSTSLNRPVLESQVNEQVAPADCFSLQSTVWSKAPPKNPLRSALHVENENSSDVQNPTREIIPFLNDHEDDIVSHHFLVGLRQMVVDSETFRETIKDTVFKKHFSNVFDEVLAQFHGKKIRDVKMHIIQTINDLIRGELSFIQLIQETCPSVACDSGVSSTSTSHLNHNNSIFDLHHLQQHQQQQSSVPLSNVTINGQVVDSSSSSGCPQLPVQIQNGDLAEADQSRVEEDEVEEEGAVGFWDLGNAPITHPPLLTNPGGHPAVNDEEAVEISAVEYQNNTESQTQFIKQGLDQVPTRLPTKSRSNTPSKSDKI